MSPRTISNQMMINLNYNDIQNYKERKGITKQYTGQLKQLVDVTFPDEMPIGVETEPPIDHAVGVGFHVDDEIMTDSEAESDSGEETDEDTLDEDSD